MAVRESYEGRQLILQGGELGFEIVKGKPMWYCPYCGVGFGHEGGATLHLYQKHLRQLNKPSERAEDSPCSHEWQFLNYRSPLEQKALSAGYSQVCKICQEVKA